MSNLQIFQSDVLNDLVQHILELDGKASIEMEEAYQKIESATHRRWLIGKAVSESIDEIKEECGSQGAFAQKFGYSEAKISNDKRGYEALLEQGAETWKEAKKLLKEKQIQITSRNFEKVGSLLNAPDDHTPIKEQRDKDERRLEQLHSEIEDIKTRNESSNPVVYEMAEDTQDYAQGVSKLLNMQNPYRSNWRSRKYMDFVKSLGIDHITGKQEENLDPHHTLPNGRSQGNHGKVADCFTIPVSRSTHTDLETGMLIPRDFDVAEALVKTMATFIQTHYPNDVEN